jgi:hypothetical protein
LAVSARRALTALAIALLAVAGLAFHELLGGWTSRFAEAGPGTALVALGIVGGLALVWVFARRHLGSTDLDRRLAVRPALAAAAALLGVAVLAGLFSSGALSARRFDAHQGFTHGRAWMWSAGYHTAIERPLYGFGAGAFFDATVRRQPGEGRVTRFAHDLPLELGVENGIAGFLLAVGLYAASGRALWRARGAPALWLLGPAVATFLLANLVDWPWHLAGVGALAALALGGLTPVRARRL